MTDETKQGEFESLISLLDDPDENIYQSVADRIRKYGFLIFPELRKALEQVRNQLQEERLNKLIDEINAQSIIDDFSHLCRSNHLNIAEALSIIARCENPDLKKRQIIQALERPVQAIKQEISLYASPIQQIKAVNHVLFTVYKFRSAPDNSFNPNFYCIDKVLATKEGNHVIIGLIYLYAARQLGFPLQPINLPMSFVLGFEASKQVKNMIAFFINPKHKGDILSKEDIRNFLKYNQIPEQDKFFEASALPEIFYRILRVLKFIYTKTGKKHKANTIIEMIKILHAQFKLK